MINIGKEQSSDQREKNEDDVIPSWILHAGYKCPSLPSQSESNDLSEALKPIWNKIDLLCDEVKSLKERSKEESRSQCKEIEREEIQKENLKLKKEYTASSNEIKWLKQEIEKLRNNTKEYPKERYTWQTIPRKSNQQQPHANNQTFQQPANNISTFLHNNKFDKLQYIPQETTFHNYPNITFPPLHTVPTTQLSHSPQNFPIPQPFQY